MANDTARKRFYIHTLGCKVNQYESQAMRELLTRSGFKECLNKDLADIYIVNTCTVTGRADSESRHVIGLLHRHNPKAKIVVTGCYVENNSEDVSFLPGVDHIVKNSDKMRVAEILLNSGPKTDPPSFCADLSGFVISDFKDHSKAFVKVQDGCENTCAYCKVQLVRGPLRSRPMAEIIEEVKVLVGRGFEEIVLTGICIGAWGKDLTANMLVGASGLGQVSLVDLLKSLNKIDGNFRIRISSIEPKYVTSQFIEFIASNKKRFCRHLHLPVQSGDDGELKRMNRPYGVSDYKDILSSIRNRVPEIAISTDIMIGFPGADDASFNNTVNFVKDILPCRTHIFTYSKRKGTTAYEMGPDIDRHKLRRWFYTLKGVTLAASYLYRRNFLGKELMVLAETKRDKSTGFLKGYSDNYIKVLFEGSDAVQKTIVPLKITDMNLLHTIGSYEASKSSA